jgi:hypothetical protein
MGPNRRWNGDNDGKPFVSDELVARMRAVLRRSSGPRHPRLTVRDLEIDLASRVVTLAGEAVQLSAKEYELLVALAEDPERVFKKEELLRNVWGFRSLGSRLHNNPDQPSFWARSLPQPIERRGQVLPQRGSGRLPLVPASRSAEPSHLPHLFAPCPYPENGLGCDQTRRCRAPGET